MKTNVKRTTGIGSLPHHNVDAALEHSFRMGIPFLPQIPIRNPWEFMLAQAMEGIPGLQALSDGTCSIAPEVWASRAKDLDRRLDQAFATAATDPQAFSLFEPGTAVSSSWQPFVWELEERGIVSPRQAKVQIAGPLTCRWFLKPAKTRDDQALDAFPGLDNQIFRVILARSLAMCRRLKSAGVRPLLFLDEPGLYLLSPENPRHVLALRELKLLIQSVRKEGVEVGLHVCSNADWTALLDLGTDILSIDTHLSLAGLLRAETRTRAEEFLRSGGKLALGVIPTGRSSLLQSLKTSDLVSELLTTLNQAWGDRPEWVQKILSDAIFTPACGLALHTPEDAEAILELLDEFHGRMESDVLAGGSTGTRG